MNQRKQQ